MKTILVLCIASLYLISCQRTLNYAWRYEDEKGPFYYRIKKNKLSLSISRPRRKLMNRHALHLFDVSKFPDSIVYKSPSGYHNFVLGRHQNQVTRFNHFPVMKGLLRLNSSCSIALSTDLHKKITVDSVFCTNINSDSIFIFEDKTYHCAYYQFDVWMSSPHIVVSNTAYLLFDKEALLPMEWTYIECKKDESGELKSYPYKTVFMGESIGRRKVFVSK